MEKSQTAPTLIPTVSHAGVARSPITQCDMVRWVGWWVHTPHPRLFTTLQPGLVPVFVGMETTPPTLPPHHRRYRQEENVVEGALEWFRHAQAEVFLKQSFLKELRSKLSFCGQIFTPGPKLSLFWIILAGEPPD